MGTKQKPYTTTTKKRRWISLEDGMTLARGPRLGGTTGSSTTPLIWRVTGTTGTLPGTLTLLPTGADTLRTAITVALTRDTGGLSSMLATTLTAGSIWLGWPSTSTPSATGSLNCWFRRGLRDEVRLRGIDKPTEDCL